MIAAYFGAALFILVGLSLTNLREADALGSSVMLLLIWAACMVLAALYEPPNSMGLYPVFDLIGLCVAGWIAKRRYAVWKVALLFCFLSQLTLHAMDRWPAFGGSTVIEHSLYLQLLDIFMGLQIACVGWPGVRHGVLLGLARAGLFDRRFVAGGSVLENRK